MGGVRQESTGIRQSLSFTLQLRIERKLFKISQKKLEREKE